MNQLVPRSTTFLPLDTDLKTCVLQHGTRSSALAEIASKGILPRKSQSAAGNWPFAPSSEEMVYLTNAYAMYYASCCERPGLATILEIDKTRLDPENLYADEDSYALTPAQNPTELAERPLEDRVAYWRQNLHKTSAAFSLQALGNCTFRGAVPPDAVVSVRLLTPKEVSTLTFAAHDPVIVPANFKIMGGAHQMFHRWLLGQDSELNDFFSNILTPSIPLMGLAEAVSYVQNVSLSA